MILYPSCQRDKIKIDSNNTFLKHKKLNKNISLGKNFECHTYSRIYLSSFKY